MTIKIGMTMSFADTILQEDLTTLRQKLLFHPLWQQIEEGVLDIRRLKLFALQDWWLVREAYRLDALAIAAFSDLAMQELLIQKLQPKIGGHQLLIRFGEALGLTRSDFEQVEPVAGCMALTNYFYWMLAYGRPEEKLAAVSASEDIFIQICSRIGPALMERYGLNEEQVAFFTVHEEIATHVQPVDTTLLERFPSPAQRQAITRAVRLSHEFELLFYDTILNTPME
jgi:pyrroloquinoline-quinone synthase